MATSNGFRFWGGESWSVSVVCVKSKAVRILVHANTYAGEMGKRKGRPTDQCRLCHCVRPLCDSHLFPRAMYRTFRDASDPKHVVLTAHRVTRTTKQMHAYLLCDECEQRFSSHGERWILRNCLTASGKFALRDALRAGTPSLELDNNSRAYPGHTPGVDVDQLVYFATSVVWRAAVYDWSQIFGFCPKLNLGPYEEQLRRFLLGLDGFPQNGTMIVYVAAEDQPYAGFVSPVGERKDGHFQYWFLIPGACFSLLLGQAVPKDTHLLCAVRSPDRVVFLTNQVRQFFERGALNLRSKLPASERLK